MIAVKLEGRLGNQLFQYAFIYAAAKKLNTNFYLDKSVDPFLLDKYFDTPNPIVGMLDRYLLSVTGFKNIFNYHLRRRFYRFLSNFYKLKSVYLDSTTPPTSHLQQLNDQTLYGGFFQSEKYFSDSQNEVLKLFRLKRHCTEQFNALRANYNIPSNYVAVHIRRGDYANESFALNFSYFQEVLASIHRQDNFYVFVSDDPDGVADEFENYPAKYISTNSEIIDFQFISNADVCILSNSSFSWWAAYLNKKGAKVIAPKYWFGFRDELENPNSIIPEKFSTFQQDSKHIDV